MGDAQLKLPISTRKASHRVAPEVFVRLRPAVPTPVYETYWRLAATRQKIFFRRIQGQPAPWTKDPILQRFKFTNTYRASDRASQFLIRHVIHESLQTPTESFFRIILFKLFNRIDTWKRLEGELGDISWSTYSFDKYDRVLDNAFRRREKLYSSAYIVPSPSIFGSKRKHRNHLRLLENMMAEDVPERLQECQRMQDAFFLIRSFPSIGDFLAYQFVTDLNYGSILDFSESEFVMPGPGAVDGIYKCFRDLGGLNEVDTIKFMTDRQEEEFREFDIVFRDLWGRRLQYIDCQNLFCEVGKYARVAHPEFPGVSGRTRIKQLFRETGQIPRPWYPPKWQINSRISSWMEEQKVTTESAPHL